MPATYEEIKKAVFYAHEKPELLTNILFNLVNSSELNESSESNELSDTSENGGE